jgi:Carboxypeptidase regulatory-like domain/TonB dependent receptor
MLRFSGGFLGKFCFLSLLFSLVANFTWAQSETATVSGQVVDPPGLDIAGAQVKLVDIDRDTSTSATTSTTGLYMFSSVKPGRYRLEVVAAGFKVVNVTGLTVNVQDHLEQNFKLVVGSISESMTVTADAYNVNTTDATVSTVVDRNFAENLPMNGRSFQTLIQLTPGVVVTASTLGNEGQFSVNGQRTASNYWMIDGVSANIGVSANPGSPVSGTSAGGAAPGFSAQGGTNSLVSVDALEEFRIQTSTYAPEFGRTPGGQISIVTRSGTNYLHGTVFDYLRNDVLDANDWFADEAGLRKPEERQNDFGGTFSGPILKNRTFFFFSYEGLRLRLPEVALNQVPSLSARQSATAAVQPLLNAFPLPSSNAPDVNGVSPFDASYSNASTLNATSLRVDHRPSDRLSLFARYSYSPSELSARYPGFALSTLSESRITTQTATVGATLTLTPRIINDIRANYSRNTGVGSYTLDDFAGAVPLTNADLQLPNPFTTQNSEFLLTIAGLQGGVLQQGNGAHNLQRQINLVDNISVQKGSHGLKCGIDYRRLNPLFEPPAYFQSDLSFVFSNLVSGVLDEATVRGAVDAAPLLRNLGVFAQDTWRFTPRLTVTYGLRWDVDFAPTTTSGPNFAAVTNFNNLSQLAVAPEGAPVFHTRFSNIAPRVGLAYQLVDRAEWEAVLRGGWGLFYDLATQQVGNLLNGYNYPFGAATTIFSVPYPLVPATAAPPPISIAGLSLPGATLPAFDPNLNLPYTMQWSLALEQSLGPQQTVTASYIGSVGRRLIQTTIDANPNPNVSDAMLISNQGTSDYDALQLQFKRRFSRGLQALVSYTWAHSIDTASDGSFAPTSISVSEYAADTNRGPSDFDIRDAVSAGITYDIPVLSLNSVARGILSDWSLENVFQARSALPVDVVNGFVYLDSAYSAYARPDLVPGVPLYLYGSAYPGGKVLNPAAFVGPPSDPTTLIAVRQGDLGRNALRGFGAWQWDFAVHRDFPRRELLRLQFRAEMFNLLNHPNFGPPLNQLGYSQFGQALQMLGSSLDQNAGGGSFSSLYQIGGPRSIQLALKLTF